MQLYKRLTRGLADAGTLIPAFDNIYEYIKSESDHYLSTYYYTEEQKKQFSEHGTVSGITDVNTNKLWWDFDSEYEPTIAQNDTVKLVERLRDLGIDARDLVLTFSGNKGFGVEVNIKSALNPKQAKKIAFDLAKDLGTFDVKMYNASRILRIIATKHQKTGLFKIPLTYVQLTTLDLDQIMDLAKKEPTENDEFRWEPVDLWTEAGESKATSKSDLVLAPTTYIDYSMKPKFLSNCRWAIQNGHFKEGDRSTALLCLASTYKNMGFDLEHVYRLLKGTAELQGRNNNCDRFPDEEIYNNIVLQVYGPHWNNGQYTCRDETNWLSHFCSTLENPCDHKDEDELKPRHLTDITGSFKDYVTRIEENTILTGLPSIDKSVFISTGANLGIIGAPGSGKTSLCLNILNNTSKAGVKTVFASLDMHKNRMYEKVLYKISGGMSRDEIYDLFKNNKEGPLLDKLKEEFGNVYFFNKSSPSVSDIRNYIISCQEKTGEKIKLVMLDYFERVSSDVGDDTAASKRVAGELQDMVNDLDIALVNLVQPHKAALSGGPESPIYDYTKIKGSSYVYQSMRMIMSMWRPFYNPKTFHDDKYMQMAVLKNDLGELTEFAFNWNGPKGEISEMEDFQRREFEEMIRAKENANKKDGWGL